VARRRLDVELVRRGLATSRQQATLLVDDGRVLVGGSVVTKAASLVAPGDPVTVSGPPPRFVSRGGDKLAHALGRFAVAVDGRRCVDVGASTGGFTDCLLQAGAASVVAIDSGHGQLHPRLRADPRVTVLERTNARHLLDTHPDIVGTFDVVVADVSFISLRTLAPVLVALARPETAGAVPADLVVLVKPQFEAGRQQVSRGQGVVRDRAVRLQALRSVADALVAAGVAVVAAEASPLLGPAGNAELLLHARAAGSGRAAPDAAMLEAAVDGAPDSAAGMVPR
jgi:23S rRNA (cytidine1920-2'-O)/16S rRNA (cytidine1409-2'-O)-methyltransferase